MADSGGKTKLLPFVATYVFALFVYIVGLMSYSGSDTDKTFKTIDAERQQSSAIIGERMYFNMQSIALALYRNYLSDTHVVAKSYDMFAVTSTEKAIEGNFNNGEAFLDKAFNKSEATLDTFWALVYLAIERAYLLLTLMPAISLGIIGFAIHGLTTWAIKRHEYKDHSPKKLAIAKWTMIFLLMSLPFLLLMPIAISTAAYLGGTIVVMACAWTAAANMPRKF